MTKDDNKSTDELVDIPLLENKYSTKDVEKGTDELADMKNSVVTICRTGLYRFEGQSKGSTVWFKLDIGVFETKFSTILS